MLSRTARLQADRAVRSIVRDYDPLAGYDLDTYLVDASYDEARKRVPQPDTFDSDARSNRAYDRWMEWRTTVEREARVVLADDGS